MGFMLQEYYLKLVTNFKITWVKALRFIPLVGVTMAGEGGVRLSEGEGEEGGHVAGGGVLAAVKS